jgi:U2 small nuclear ribonucleoprotein B''
VAKLDGTFKMPNSTAGAANVEVTELQQSIFNAPAPGTSQSGPAAGARAVPAKPSTQQSEQDAKAQANRGQKRVRDEEEEEDDSDEDVAMEEDSDDD